MNITRYSAVILKQERNIMINRGAILILLISFTPTIQAANFYAGVYAGMAAHNADLSQVNESRDTTVGFDIVKEYQAPDETAVSKSLILGYKLGKDLALELGVTNIDKFKGSQRTFTDYIIPVDPVAPLTDDPDTNLFAVENVDVDYISIAFVGEWPVLQKWALHAKFGVAAWKYSYKQIITEVNQTVLNSQLDAQPGSPNPVCYSPSDPSSTRRPCPAVIAEPAALPVNLGPEYDELVVLDDFREESYSDTGIDFLYGVGVAYAIDQMFEVRFDIEAHSFNPKFTNIEVDTKLTTFSIGFITHF